MTKQTTILIALFSVVISGILLTAFFGMVTVKPTPTEPTTYEFTEPKDWYLDSTMTEQRHIYYETQWKMK